MLKIFKPYFLLTFQILLTLLVSSHALANNPVEIQSKSLAKITKLIGTAEISENNKWTKLKKDMVIEMYHRVKTANKSKLELVFQDGSKLRMNENSSIILVRSKNKEYSIFDLSAGQVWANIANKGKGRTTIKTNSAVLAVMGTVFDVNSDNSKTEMSVFNGSVGVQSKQTDLEKLETNLNKLVLTEDTKDITKKEQTLKPQVLSKPKQVEKPYHIVPGPYKVSLDKWLEITENKQIVIDNNGNAIVSNQENDKLKYNDWVNWNKQQDSE
ncbi:MAG: FecR family protein [Candidatus Sericytochromatia bacterium]